MATVTCSNKSQHRMYGGNSVFIMLNSGEDIFRSGAISSILSLLPTRLPWLLMNTAATCCPSHKWPVSEGKECDFSEGISRDAGFPPQMMARSQACQHFGAIMNSCSPELLMFCWEHQKARTMVLESQVNDLASACSRNRASIALCEVSLLPAFASVLRLTPLFSCTHSVEISAL